MFSCRFQIMTLFTYRPSSLVLLTSRIHIGTIQDVVYDYQYHLHSHWHQVCLPICDIYWCSCVNSDNLIVYSPILWQPQKWDSLRLLFIHLPQSILVSTVYQTLQSALLFRLSSLVLLVNSWNHFLQIMFQVSIDEYQFSQFLCYLRYFFDFTILHFEFLLWRVEPVIKFVFVPLAFNLHLNTYSPVNLRMVAYLINLVYL